MMDKKEKLEWGKILKPGDLVCDCRFKHTEIKTIVPVLNEGDTSLGHEILCKFGEAYDYNIELVDGVQCSLVHCCDPIDHPWALHEVSDMEEDDACVLCGVEHDGINCH